jgi:hypothetical protein
MLCGAIGALPFGRLRYGEPNAISNAVGYAKHRSRSHRAVIRVYDEAGDVIETQISNGLAQLHTRARACGMGSRSNFHPALFGVSDFLTRLLEWITGSC